MNYTPVPTLSFSKSQNPSRLEEIKKDIISVCKSKNFKEPKVVDSEKELDFEFSSFGELNEVAEAISPKYRA